MNILITGAAGFVGAHLARALRAAGGVPWGTGLEPLPPGSLAGDSAVARIRKYCTL